MVSEHQAQKLRIRFDSMNRVKLSLQRVGAVLCAMIEALSALTASHIGKRRSSSAEPQKIAANGGACEFHAPPQSSAAVSGDRRVTARGGLSPAVLSSVVVDGAFPAMTRSPTFDLTLVTPFLLGRGAYSVCMVILLNIMELLDYFNASGKSLNIPYCFEYVCFNHLISKITHEKHRVAV